MYKVAKFIDTKTIIVNLLREDKTEFISLGRLQNLLKYIYVELWKLKKLQDYQITFEVNFDAIERTVIYNRDIFGLDVEEETIYLRDFGRIDSLAQIHSLDETILRIVQNFVVAA